MDILVRVIHILISVILIFVVLLQSGKGAEMGAAFGGSSSRALFGATGANTFMTKLTTFIAVLFIITCLVLAYRSSHMATSSVMTDFEEQAPPVTIPAAAGVPTDVTIPPAEESHEGHDHPPAEAPPAEESHEGHNHPPGEGH